VFFFSRNALIISQVLGAARSHQIHVFDDLIGTGSVLQSRSSITHPALAAR